MSSGTGPRQPRRNLRSGLRALWDSPTFMTWGSFLSKALSLVLVLPFLLTRLDTAEISVWYLFMTAITFQMLVDVGFAPSFSRVIAYAMGGATVDQLSSPGSSGQGTANWETVRAIWSTMQSVYSRLSLVWTALLAILGTAAMVRPISLIENPFPAWLAWGVILVVSTASLRATCYSAFLQGTNEVALFRRWEMLSALASIPTTLAVLYLGGGLLGLVIANQGWQLFNLARNRWLTLAFRDGLVRTFGRDRPSDAVLAAVWPRAWRSGIGILMSYGVVQASGFFYAQIGSAAGVASYLLGLCLISAVSQFSTAPFYSKIPHLARLFSEGKQQELVARARRGMLFAHWSYAIGFVALGVVGEPLLRFIGSNAEFPAPLLWALLGLGFFADRYGSMHIQLYSTTNHIIWHVANGVTGTLYLVAGICLFPRLGVYAFPVAMILGYLGFHCWYSAGHSYRYFKLRFLPFEGTASLPQAGLILGYAAVAFYLS